MTLRITYFASVSLGVLAWGGLAALIYYFPPESLTLAAALLLLVLAIAGTSVPLWGRLQARLTPKMIQPAVRNAALRQGLWAGLFAASVVVLRLLQLLDWILVLVLLILFIMLETFIQQRSTWRELQSTTNPQKGQTSTKTGE